MATAYVAFGKAGPRGEYDNLPVVSGAPTSSETVTTSATATQTAQAASVNGIVLINCDTALYATVGDDPTVTPSTGWYIKPNVEFAIGVVPGNKVSLINV